MRFLAIALMLSLTATAFLLSAGGAEGVADMPDPTVAADAMADRLKARIAESGRLKVWALVVGVGDDGVALVGETAASARVVRGGGVLAETVDGVRVSARVKAVGAEGVELEPTGDGKAVFLPGAYAPLPPPDGCAGGEFVRYLEADGVPLPTLMRLLSDRTGVNISTSDATSGKTVSIFLRNVTADVAVEEICRATGLWFRRESGGCVVRVTTMEEYAENLNTFREEATETFTLLYPNVIEVAASIYGLYPDRTLLSLGEEEFDEDDEYDLSRRFRRFRVIEENGNSQFMEMQAPRASGSGGARAGSGNFSFSRGSALSRLAQWDRLNDRRRFRDAAGSTLSQAEAEALENASRQGDTNLYLRVAGRCAPGAANIFVSLSRKSNMLIVRTSDRKVMDEIRRLVRRLDVPTPMVLMEVKVLELDVTDAYDAGIRWTLLDHGSGSGDGVSTHALGGAGRDGAVNLVAKTLAGAQTAFDPTFKFMALSDYIKAEIELMQKDGKAKTLATPTLLSANNEVSRIFSGKEYPLVTGWTRGETTVTDGVVEKTVPTVEMERKDVGTMLLITPNINADRTVTLRLLQENSEVSPNKVDIPVEGGFGETRAVEYVESRSLAGTFVARDGMTVMAGGLVREHEEEIHWRTPLLGSLPLVGWLFRGTDKVKKRTELVVLIRPHVILTPQEGARVSRDLAERLSAHPARDGRDSLMTNRDPKTGEVEERGLEDDARNLVK